MQELQHTALLYERAVRNYQTGRLFLIVQYLSWTRLQFSGSAELQE